MDPMAGRRASRWELGQAAGRGRHHRCGLSKEKTTSFLGSWAQVTWAQRSGNVSGWATDCDKQSVRWAITLAS